MNGFHLAQVNIARALEPLDDPLLAEFVARLDEINALADESPGFIWRLQSESGNATDIRVSDDPRVLINLSVWESAESLFDYVYKSMHGKVMARRREWFEPHAGHHLVLWWIAAGHIPDVAEAMDRLDHLKRNGPTPEAFTFRRRYPPQATAAARADPT